jgi:hypothetical protein
MGNNLDCGAIDRRMAQIMRDVQSGDRMKLYRRLAKQFSLFFPDVVTAKSLSVFNYVR